MSKWPMMPLSQVLSPYQEYIETPEPKEYPKLSVKLYGKGVVLDTPADGTTLKMKRHQIAKAGQVILSEIWGKKGAIGFVPQEGDGALCTSHFFLFDVYRDKLKPKYLQAIFTANYLQDQLDVEAKGTTGYAAVRPKNLLAAEIPLPPLPEQRRIVARIESLAEKIEYASRCRTQAIAESNYLIGPATDKLLTQLRLPHRQLEEIAVKITDGEHITPRRSESGRCLLSARNIQDGAIDLRNVDYVDDDEFQRIRRRCDPDWGDVLVSCSGSIGKTAVVDRSDTYVMVRSVAMIRTRTDVINPEYLAHALRAPLLQEQMRLHSKSTAQANLFLGRIKKLQLPVPDMAEQRRIVEYLDDLQAKVDALKKLQAETADKLAALLPSILDKAFKGEL